MPASGLLTRFRNCQSDLDVYLMRPADVFPISVGFAAQRFSSLSRAQIISASHAHAANTGGIFREALPRDLGRDSRMSLDLLGQGLACSLRGKLGRRTTWGSCCILKSRVVGRQFKRVSSIPIFSVVILRASRGAAPSARPHRPAERNCVWPEGLHRLPRSISFHR